MPKKSEIYRYPGQVLAVGIVAHLVSLLLIFIGVWLDVDGLVGLAKLLSIGALFCLLLAIVSALNPPSKSQPKAAVKDIGKD